LWQVKGNTIFDNVPWKPSRVGDWRKSR
jgi:hypothetical protein